MVDCQLIYMLVAAELYVSCTGRARAARLHRTYALDGSYFADNLNTSSPSCFIPQAVEAKAPALSEIIPVDDKSQFVD